MWYRLCRSISKRCRFRLNLTGDCDLGWQSGIRPGDWRRVSLVCFSWSNLVALICSLRFDKHNLSLAPLLWRHSSDVKTTTTRFEMCAKQLRVTSQRHCWDCQHGCMTRVAQDFHWGPGGRAVEHEQRVALQFVPELSSLDTLTSCLCNKVQRDYFHLCADANKLEWTQVASAIEW